MNIQVLIDTAKGGRCLSEWKDFELLLAELQKQTAPDAHVQHNHRIKGRSGRVRQLDITISQNVGLYPVLVVIECKRYKRPVGIEKMESFITKLRDVGASQGVMISNTSFDAGAKAVAKDNFITLLSYREAKEVDWRSALGEESWLSFIVTRVENTSVTLTDRQQNILVPVNSDATLYDLNGSVIITPADLYRSFEESFAISSEIGGFEGEMVPEQAVYARTENGLQQIQKIVMRGTVRGWQYLLNLTLASGHVLENAETQQTVLNQVISNSIDKDALLRQPGREITKSEHELLKRGATLTAPLDLNKVKRYLRIVATKKDS